MAGIFRYIFFNSANDAANLTLDEFIPRNLMWVDMLFEINKKKGHSRFSLVVFWHFGSFFDI